MKYLNSKRKILKLYHRKTYVLGLVFIFIIANIQQSSTMGFSNPHIINFTGSPSIVDVNEPVEFTWTIVGSFDVAIISYGDGNQTEMTMTQEDDTYSFLHTYAVEGKYNVSLYVANSLTRDEDWDASFITVQNNPPRFALSAPLQAEEDELVNISINNLQESDYDRKMGVISYRYDFADNNQTTTNSTSILHKWSNAGIYPITVTARDDQNALFQRVTKIKITNRAPVPDFSLGSEIPATYGFYTDLIGAFPFGWISINNESFEAFKVQEGSDNHQKILEITSQPLNDVEIYNVFNPQSSGTVELWFMSKNIGSSVGIFSFKNSAQIDQFSIFIKNGRWYYRTDAGDRIISRVPAPIKGIWHHIRIDFLTVGKYMDLRSNTFQITIDNKRSGIIDFAGEEIERIHISANVGFGDIAYIDAIGFSWRNYEVGNNHQIFGKEYYATYDFMEETIGSKPSEEDWNLLRTGSNEIGSFSIVDVGYDSLGGYEPSNNPHGKVVEIRDNSNTASLVMENNYTDQAYGTVEFWVMTNNTKAKTWASCLMQNDLLAMGVLIDDNKWKYTINDIDYHIIQNVGIPENNTFYHVRLDFRGSGADPYFSLQENRFMVYIDNVSSPQYAFTMLYSINKIRITTGRVDTGVAYLDSIGYSWDPYYDIGDNRYLAVQFPEKTLIWLSASLTTDTPSDVDSLSYFWDLGGSSDLGKYISHEYVTSGKYYIKLTVMDDNGENTSKTKIVLIGNRYPNIEFTSFQGEISTYEGTTVTFNTVTDDENADLAQMDYYWYLNGPNFDPYNVSQYQQGGWVNSHIFTDDYDGQLYAMARDPEGAFDFDFLDITILNVNPSVSIHSLDLLANLTFEVERSGPPFYDNNFTFLIQSTDKFGSISPYLVKTLNFADSEENTENHQEENILLSLLKDWKILINTSSGIYGKIQYTITLDFQDGQSEVIQSSQFSSGNAYWELKLNSMLYDGSNYTIKHPIQAGVSIWDPSVDDINLDLNYSVEMVVEIQCLDSLPISKSFSIDNTFFYDIYVYMSDGKTYANISAYTQIAASDEFKGSEFPVNFDSLYILKPIIDLTRLLDNHPDGPQLSNFSVVECISAVNFLDAFVKDDDGGNSSVIIKFDTQDEIEVYNLSPDITLIHSDSGLIDQNITFYLDYYYRSYYRNDANMVFESISTYKPSQEQNQSSPYGNQTTDNGSSGDNGYVSTHQSTDSENNSGSVLFNYGSQVNSNSNNSGTVFPQYRQGTISDAGGTDSMSYSTGSYNVYESDTHTDWTQYSINSLTDIIYHYPGNPGNSWRTTSDFYDGSWSFGDQNGYVFYGAMTQNHGGYGMIYYDGSGDSSYIYRNVGERSSGRVEAWIKTEGSDGIVALYDGGGYDIVFQFNENGVYYYNWVPPAWPIPGYWSWSLFTTNYNDNEWHRFVVNLQSDNQFDFYLYEADGSLRYMILDVNSERTGSIDQVRFFTEINSPAGWFSVDGVGLTWDSEYTYNQNWVPYQMANKYVFNIPMYNMNKDNYDRATLVQTYVKWKVDFQTSPPATVPTFKVFIQGPGSGTGYTQVLSKTGPLDNSWYGTWITIGKEYCYGDYDLDYYFEVTTGINDLTAPYSFDIQFIQTYWEESRYTGNKYEYSEPGGSIDTGAHELSTSVDNNFQRDYVNSFDFSLSWRSTYSKTFYVQLWDYVANNWDNAWGEYGPHTGSGSLSVSATVTSNASRFFEDVASPKLKYRLYSTTSSEPATVEMQSSTVNWSYKYTYWAEHEITLAGMNQFRYLTFDSTVGKGLELTFIYTSAVTTGKTIRYEVYNWITGQYVEEYTNAIPGNRIDSFRIYSKNYIHGITYKVRIRQIIINNDTECVLAINGGLSHEYFWKYSYFDTYRMELPGMNDFRIDHIMQFTVSYSIGTHDPRIIDIQAYKHSGGGTGWNIKNTASTFDNPGGTPFSNFDSGSFLVDKDYIYYDSGKYYIDIHFDNTTSPTATIFEVNYLTVDWTYSYSWNDIFEVSLANMNVFRYVNFVNCSLSYTISTRSETSVDVSLWDYTLNGGAGDWVYYETVTAGISFQNSVYFTNTNYMHSSTYKVTIKFDQFSNTEFNLDAASANWDYSYSYYDTFELDLSEMTQFRYTYFDKCTLDYQIDLPRTGKSTTVYMYNFTKSDWDYFKTTLGGANDIQDSITFNSLDYINNGSNMIRIRFTGFSSTEFNRDSIVANYSWEHNVQDKYYTVLNDMTTLRFNSFEECNITFSIQSSEDQTLQVELYDFISLKWTAVGFLLNTIKDDDYNGSIMFTSDNFIHPTEYTTKIFFRGVQDSFLTLNTLENNYSWSHYYTYTDFGYDNQGMEGNPYADMTTIYRNVYTTHNIFDYSGEFVVTWTVSDGMHETKEGQLIEIIYPIPSISIGDIPYYIEEDEQVYLESSINFAEEYTQEAEYQFFWDFGDGYHSVDRNPTHAWSDSGNYTITLYIRDLYGNCYNNTIMVEIEEKLPEIIGPFGFSGIEGQAIILEVAVSDSIFDRNNLLFTWYDEKNQEIMEFANNQKPIVILNDGVYNYSLEIEDLNGNKDFTDILITVNDIPPSIFIPSYMYHGDQNSGSLTLTAFAFDYYKDVNMLEFTWRISHNERVDNRGPFSNVNQSSIVFNATKTAIYQGEVSVRDPNTSILNKQIFYIYSVIDSNGNGFSDEFEQELTDNGENIYDYFDTDQDGISDLYEITHNKTDYLDPDTDKDGLYDGIDRLTGMGERSAGTNPINYDSDGDLLSDGEEVYGWEISTDREENIHVSSDPWLSDTDGDGWTDYEEYLHGTHPHIVDTDLDGINDPQDPYPVNADKDEDGLFDSEELALGTAVDNSDTDGDTLTDGEEVRGGLTSPLSADTDRDFASDNAEVITKENSIQNRMSLDQPVIIHFNQYFQYASAAQISFVLAFGEFDETVNYGIEDIPDLNVRVTKIDNNLVLYEGNTNGKRYFSNAIDFREVIENKGYNYYGDYVISVNKTGVGCMLEQFDINVAGRLDPGDADSDDDGIMDGIEMDTLILGKRIINFTSDNKNNITANNISPPEPYDFNIEVGSVQLKGTIDQSVVASITFQNDFSFPVVVAYISSRNEDDSVEVRIDNVTSTGCDIFMEEPGDGSHASETINYIVVEHGEWEFPDGTDIKAGIVAIDQAHQGSSSYSNWKNVEFRSPFSGFEPVVLHSLNTYNNDDFKTSIVSEVTQFSFNITQESGETGSSTAEEIIGWIVIESGKIGTINNVKYETIQENDGNSDGVSDDGHMFFFQQDFLTIPDVIVVKQTTANNGDGSWARSQGTLSGSTHVTYAEEDQASDSERNHPDEYFGLVAFESTFSFGFDYVPQGTEPEEEIIIEEEGTEADVESFYLTIPDFGRVYEAYITIEIASENTPNGYGTINITLIKEDISSLIEDLILINYYKTFNQTDVYFNKFLDLTTYVNNDTIHQFYGVYRLDVVIFNNNSTDIFNVTKYYIETDTYIKASESDTEAWVTNPSSPDTDGDTITDYAEIYGWTRGSEIFYTNPLSADSDEDGADDNVDRHPTENVMIKISPLSATHRSQTYWEASPKLEIVISYELNGDYSNRQKIFSPAIRATEDLITQWILWFKYSHYRRTNFAINDIHYYVDIDDNPDVQPENMDFGFSLWHMDVADFFGILLWDTWLAGGSVVYSIGNIGHSATFDIYYTGIWGQPNELHVKVETISVIKSNTIAIYKNDTIINGHFKEKEKMNVIVLEVTGNVQDTPFVQGPNAIVIPTELFIETMLNSYLERDMLEETPLYSSVEGEYEFISVGRNGSTEKGCDKVDFAIIRFNIDIDDAMIVLSMLTTVILNDTTGEEVELYDYQSTKEDGINAVLMNVYKEVLGYIPWYGNFQNSELGDEPGDFFEFWAEIFVGALMAVVYFIYIIGMAIASLFVALVKFVGAVMMEVLTFLGPFLWLIIRAVLFVLAFILLAIHLLVQIPTYLIMGVSMLLIATLMGGYCEFSWNFVEFSLDNVKVFRMQSDIVWVYWGFFDMEFPWVDDKIFIDGELIMSTSQSILGLESKSEFTNTDIFSTIDSQTPPELHCGYNLTDGSTYDFYVTYQDFENNAPDPSYGVKLHLINPDGTTLSPNQMSIHPDYVDDIDYRKGVLYNYTIDLDTIYQGQGLWHYYFTTQDDSSAHDIVFMPDFGYKLGPDVFTSQYLLTEHVSRNYPDEYSSSSGFIDEDFTFVTTWSSEMIPDNVYMYLIPAQRSVGTGVSKTVGIQKFPMSTVDLSPDYSDYVDYYVTINFSQLGYTEAEIGKFSHYYEAIYYNGNKTYLYDAELDSESFYDLTYTDFNTPYVGTSGAQLLDSQFENLNFISDYSLHIQDNVGKKELFTVISEYQMRFEVIYTDPLGLPPSYYPHLIFKNVATGEELVPFVLSEESQTEFSLAYGEDVSSYSTIIEGFELPPGLWVYRFEAKDNRDYK